MKCSSASNKLQPLLCASVEHRKQTNSHTQWAPCERLAYTGLALSFRLLHAG